MKASNEFQTAIKVYLDVIKKDSPELAESLTKEGKTLSDCCNYILQEVQKKKVNAMADQDVFDLAVAYYLDEKVNEVKEVKCKVVVTSDKISAATPKPKVSKVEKTAKETHVNQMSIFDLIS